MTLPNREPRPMNGLAYRMMSYLLRHMKPEQFVDDLLRRSRVVPGAIVLDYACGPGVFVIPAAKAVGSGHIYAADIHPLAIKEVEAAARREKLTNVTAIQTGCATGLEDGSVDVVLLFDCFHHFKEPGPVLAELHRVLKDDGCLSLRVDHGGADAPARAVEATGLFEAVGTNLGGKHRLFIPRR
ncbi:MAG: class I SAM-dependent methyltransferase [Candidatus Lokiarchaeota archaeon]|nr:class I SAM-dependent methyltransferase [Candidatus Lokiarchaeota archaeon]